MHPQSRWQVLAHSEPLLAAVAHRQSVQHKLKLNHPTHPSLPWWLRPRPLSRTNTSTIGPSCQPSRPVRAAESSCSRALSRCTLINFSFRRIAGVLARTLPLIVKRSVTPARPLPSARPPARPPPQTERRAAAAAVTTTTATATATAAVTSTADGPVWLRGCTRADSGGLEAQFRGACFRKSQLVIQRIDLGEG